MTPESNGGTESYAARLTALYVEMSDELQEETDAYRHGALAAVRSLVFDARKAARRLEEYTQTGGRW